MAYYRPGDDPLCDVCGFPHHYRLTTPEDTRGLLEENPRWTWDPGHDGSPAWSWAPRWSFEEVACSSCGGPVDPEVGQRPDLATTATFFDALLVENVREIVSRT